MHDKVHILKPVLIELESRSLALCEVPRLWAAARGVCIAL